MKRLLYIIALVLILAATGFVTVSFMQSRSQSELLAKYDSTTTVALPTALVGFPDIEYIPIYPTALVTSATISFNGHVRPIADVSRADISRDVPDDRSIMYEVTDSPDMIAEFYQVILSKKGWSLLSSREQVSLYSWTDPAGKRGWGQHLEVVIGSTVDNSKTLVNLNYGRHPIIGEGLPLYADAQKVATTQSDTEKSYLFGEVPVHVTNITYLSSASPQEIADFYNNSMFEYGWEFFDRSGAGEVEKQTGDISSQEGIYFRSAPHIGGDVSYHLFVTATMQKDGRTFVKLHVEELKITNNGP